ncbi:Aldehyde dehydrogenase [Quillaja saponaria]|uniref:Aldehyde dehydrogenase n=1 Tax=Quillaja saponaria TaxID=32244 RepID=A0AAD7LWJ9_QUISA|nr:Aldehyde dehydrogenase [Quillaja saponaria]
MAAVEGKKLFDAKAVVKELRVAFDSGTTRSYEWRVSQIKAIIKLTEDNEEDITKALHADLSKSPAEAFIQEFWIWFINQM